MILNQKQVNSTSRKIHKWLMLFLSIQFVIWSISGVYMVVFDIDYIHGDSLVIDDQSFIDHQQINYSLNQLFSDYPQAKNLELSTFLGTSVYRFVQPLKQKSTNVMLDANSGQLLSPLTKNTAEAVARFNYQGEGVITNIELLTDNAPFELSSRHLPVWRVDYDDFGSPTLYISAQSGKVVTRRHQFWRIFDLMFSLHVMDYEDEDPANKLLLFFALFSVLAVISGMVLTYYRLLKGKIKNNAHKKQRRGKQ